MNGGRVNQKARTRAAILDAAIEILREGSEPTVPDAAERARVSAATAYRYFTSADELLNEASAELLSFVSSFDELGLAIEAAGQDVHARLDTLVRFLGGRMLHDPAPYRQQAKAGYDRWFAQHNGKGDRAIVRAGRRNQFIRQAVSPLEGRLPDADHARLCAALAVGFGTEATISLTDVAGLDADAALEVMATTCRWILDGALAEAGLAGTGGRDRRGGRTKGATKG